MPPLIRLVEFVEFYGLIYVPRGKRVVADAAAAVIMVMASVKKLDKPAANRDHRQIEILG